MGWLFDANLQQLAANDDASLDTTDSRLTQALPASGTYYIAFREFAEKSATFTVELEGMAPPSDGGMDLAVDLGVDQGMSADLASPADMAMSTDLASPAEMAMPADLAPSGPPPAGITCHGILHNYTTAPEMVENNVYVWLSGSNLYLQSSLLAAYVPGGGYLMGGGLCPTTFGEAYVGSATTNGLSCDQYGSPIPSPNATVTVSISGERGVAGGDPVHGPMVTSVYCSGTGVLHFVAPP
jgi:hypothetical protein